MKTESKETIEVSKRTAYYIDAFKEASLFYDKVLTAYYSGKDQLNQKENDDLGKSFEESFKSVIDTLNLMFDRHVIEGICYFGEEI